jgi:hypothetical protein
MSHKAIIPMTKRYLDKNKDPDIPPKIAERMFIGLNPTCVLSAADINSGKCTTTDRKNMT